MQTKRLLGGYRESSGRPAWPGHFAWGNWRLAFSFDGEEVVLVDYRDYH